jgi:hypothetical protein
VTGERDKGTSPGTPSDEGGPRRLLVAEISPRTEVARVTDPAREDVIAPRTATPFLPREQVARAPDINSNWTCLPIFACTPSLAFGPVRRARSPILPFTTSPPERSRSDRMRGRRLAAIYNSSRKWPNGFVPQPAISADRTPNMNVRRLTGSGSSR